MDLIKLIMTQNMVREFRSLDFWKWLEMMDGTPVYKNAVFVALVSTVLPILNMPPLILSTYSETIQALHLKAPTCLPTQIGHPGLLPFSFPCSYMLFGSYSKHTASLYYISIYLNIQIISFSFMPNTLNTNIIILLLC